MKIKILSLLFLTLLVSCMQPKPRKPVTVKTTSFMEASVSFNKALNENEERVFHEIIAKDSLSNYISSPSGFWYKYNTKSTNLYTPKFGDQLLYTFDVLNLENNIIYSAQETGLQTYVVDQQEIVEGLRNGLKIMHEGDDATFLFPSHKVFGYLGDENKIGINQSLIYKVQLIKINKKNENN